MYASLKQNLQTHFNIALDLDEFLRRCFNLCIVNFSSLTISNVYFKIKCDSLNMNNFYRHVSSNLFAIIPYLHAYFNHLYLT